MAKERITKEQQFINGFEKNSSGQQRYEMVINCRGGGCNRVYGKFVCMEVLPDGTGDGVLYFIKDDGGYVHLVLLRSMTTQKGFGTKFMSSLTTQADEARITIKLDPYPQIKGLKISKLKEWYRRFGFKAKEGKYIRNPQEIFIGSK